jgi:hypothetical protein
MFLPVPIGNVLQHRSRWEKTTCSRDAMGRYFCRSREIVRSQPRPLRQVSL